MSRSKKPKIPRGARKKEAASRPTDQDEKWEGPRCSKCSQPIVRNGRFRGQQRWVHKDTKRAECATAEQRLTLNESLAQAATGQGPDPKTGTLKAWVAENVKTLLRARKRPENHEQLLATLKGKFPESLKGQEKELNHELAQALKDLLLKGRAELIGKLMKAHYTAEKIVEVLKRHKRPDDIVPPVWVVQIELGKFRELHGLTTTSRETLQDLHGINRAPILEVAKRDLPVTSYSSPLHVLPDVEGKRIRFGIISSAKIGMPFDPDIERNLVRCGFAGAREVGCHALVIAGGLLHFTIQKTSGPTRLLASLANGIEVDPKTVASYYRDKMREIIETGSYKPIYVKTFERLTEAYGGWRKVFIATNKRKESWKEFESPIYIVLNSDDQKIAISLAYYELLFEQKLESADANADLRAKAVVRKEAFDAMSEARLSGDPSWIKAAEAAFKVADTEAREAADYVSRVLMTNLDDTQNTRVMDQALSYVISQIEEAVPGAKVVGKDCAYLKFGGNPGVMKVISSGIDWADPYEDEVAGYGHDQREGTLADLTIVAHSRSLYWRKTPRENYKSENYADHPPAGFVECPMLIDKEAVLAKLKGARSKNHTIKTVCDRRFEAGITVVDLYPDREPDSHFVRSGYLRKLGALRGQKAKYTPPKMMWHLVSTDMHYASRNRLYVEDRYGVPTGLTEAVCELMVPYIAAHNGLAPVITFISPDDGTQGNHIDNQNKPHPNWVANGKIFLLAKEWRKQILEIKDPKVRDAENLKLQIFLLNQLRVRPPDHQSSQFEEVQETLILPFGKTVFKGIIMRAHATGVHMRTMSDGVGVQDSRDVGLVILPTGNHATKGTKGQVFEGPILRNYLRNLLKYDPDFVRLGIDVERVIHSPLSQDRATGYGTIKVGEHGYEYGLNTEGSPPVRDTWSDTVHGWVRVDARRGDRSGMHGKKTIIHVGGNWHFNCTAFATGHLYHMGPPDTHTDAYADIAAGLPPNNAGKTLIGVSVDGPDAGPIKVVHMTAPFIQHHLKTGIPVDWDGLCENAV